jgi:hypothetical protein
MAWTSFSLSDGRTTEFTEKNSGVSLGVLGALGG